MTGTTPSLNRAPVPNDEPVPLPWLRKEDPSKDSASQPWRIAGLPGEVLVLEYRYRPLDYIRCYSLLFLLRWRVYTATSFLTAVLITVCSALMFNHAANVTATSIGLGIVILLVSFVMVFVFTVAATLLMVPFIGIFLSVLRRKPIRFALNIAGVTEKALRKTTVKWSYISQIVEEKGDIHFVSRVFLYDGLSVPRTAFADHAAAQRFYAAAIDLWKANGDPDAVPPEARTEFAPT